MSKQSIKVGDKFETQSGAIYKVVGLKPGGKIEFYDEKRVCFIYRWSRDVKQHLFFNEWKIV